MKNPIYDPYQKLCKYRFCKKEFVAKRLNMDYCSHEHKVKECNARLRDKTALTAPDEKVIRNNRIILERLYLKGMTSPTKELLEALGLIEDRYTRTESNRNGRTTWFHEFGLQVTSDQNLKIIKK